MEETGFYTLRGYSRMESSGISPSMEDYLEMIYRLLKDAEYVRINQLASLINVKPPSASKMANKLKTAGLIQFEPYGNIRLTQKGEELGAYLLHRHNVLHRFFCRLNGTENELNLVEKIEHFIDSKTIENLEKLLTEIE